LILASSAVVAPVQPLDTESDPFRLSKGMFSESVALEINDCPVVESTPSIFKVAIVYKF
jgi:hypothetical protein